jgi:hypothetical protein
MKNLAFVAGLLIVAIGVIGIVEPPALVWLAPQILTPQAFYVVGVVRVGLGLVLISVASRCRAPRLLRVVGYLVLAAGFATVATGAWAMDRARAIVEWWLQEGPLLARLTGAGVVMFGGFIAYACGPGRSPGLQDRAGIRTPAAR